MHPVSSAISAHGSHSFSGRQFSLFNQISNNLVNQPPELCISCLLLVFLTHRATVLCCVVLCCVVLCCVVLCCVVLCCVVLCCVVLCCVASLPATLLAKFGMVFWGVRLLTGVPNPMPKQTERRSPRRALICYGDRSCCLPTASNRSSALTPSRLFLKVRGGSLKESRGPEKGLCMCVVCAYLLVGARG